MSLERIGRDLVLCEIALDSHPRELRALPAWTTEMPRCGPVMQK